MATFYSWEETHRNILANRDITQLNQLVSENNSNQNVQIRI